MDLDDKWYMIVLKLVGAIVLFFVSMTISIILAIPLADMDGLIPLLFPVMIFVGPAIAFGLVGQISSYLYKRKNPPPKATTSPGRTVTTTSWRGSSSVTVPTATIAPQVRSNAVANTAHVKPSVQYSTNKEQPLVFSSSNTMKKPLQQSQLSAVNNEELRKRQLQADADFYRNRSGYQHKVEEIDKELGRSQAEIDSEDLTYHRYCSTCGELEDYCKCCSRCDSYPCECCSTCGEAGRYCRCCSRCDSYPCECCSTCGEAGRYCRCCSRCDSYPCECCSTCGQSNRYCRCD